MDSGPGDPAFNMALDEALLEGAARLVSPVLRFYGWTEPAATFGYFQKFAEVERATLLRPLIRRPTGGGIVPHDADWTYSLVFPPNHEWYLLKAEESYRRVHEWIRSAFAKLKIASELAPACKKSAPGECFVGHVKFDLLWRGRKIAGAAQRRNKLGLLIQGSVQPSTLRSKTTAEDGPPISPARPDWEQAMGEAGSMAFGINWSDFQPETWLRARAVSLAAQKYSQPEFITKR